MYAVAPAFAANAAYLMNRLAVYIVAVGGMMAVPFLAFSQGNHNYYYFNIAGPTTVCPDGTTVYTYSSYIGSTVWTINGGTFVSGNNGASVTVKWNSMSGSLSAVAEESNCWYDPEIYPPVLYCDYDHYTSNPFQVYGSVTQLYVSGGGYVCAASPVGLPITLSGSQTNCTYQLFRNGTVEVGLPKIGNGFPLSWPDITTPGSYTVTPSCSSGGCSAATGTAYITESQSSVGGTVSGSISACGGISHLYFDLSGHLGGIVRWEKHDGSGWTTINSSSSQLYYTDLVSVTTTFRAVVQNQPCALAYSSTATVTIYPCTPVAGAPTHISATGFTANWSSSAGSSSYELDLATSSTFGATLIGSYPVSGSSLALSGLIGGTTYYYRVQGVSAGGSSAESNVIQVVLPLPPPTMLAGANVSYNSFVANWSTVSGATHYLLDVSTNSSFGFDYNLYNNYYVSGSQFAVQGLEVGATYYVRAQAVKSGVPSVESNAVSVVLIPFPPIGQTEICEGYSYAYFASYTPQCTGGCTSTVSNDFTITGGNIVTTGDDYAIVTWTSASGNLTISSTETICWPDVLDQYGNPVCNTNTSTENIPVTQHTASVSGSFPHSVCQGSTVVLTANTGTGLTYQWKKNGTDVSGTSSTYTVGLSGDVSETGNYTVNVIKNGCAIESGAITVTILANPDTPVITTKALELIPGATMLTAANTVSPQWKRDGTTIVGAATSTLLATKPASYTVTSTVNTCTVSSAAMVITSGNDANFSVSNEIMVPGITTEEQLYDLLHNDNKFLQTIGYGDGVGRQAQTILTRSSPVTSAGPGKKDIISIEEYDALGRSAKKHLPFMSQQAGGLWLADAVTAQSTFYQATGDLVEDDQEPYSVTEFEASPLSRAIKQGDVGTDWQPNVAPKSMAYGTNVATGLDAIQIYTISGSLPVSTATYPVGVLSVTTATNEQGVESQSVTARDGRRIVTRTKVGSAWAETYNVYDDRMQLRFVLPPELMKLLRQASNFSPTQQQIDTWCYQSVYDNDGREVETKGPGTGWVYTIYDTRDRVVLTQDARQRLTNDWSYTKYDALDRPVISGIYHSPTSVTRANMQAQVNALNGNAGYQNILTQSGIVIGTEDEIFPDGNDEPLVISYYDDYTTCAPCGDTNLLFVQESWSDPLDLSSAKYNVLGSKIASKVRILDSLAWLSTVSYYNKNGEVVQIIGTNHLGGRDRVSTLMDFSGKVLEERQAAIGYNSGGINTIKKRFIYDHAGRLEKTFHQINNQPEAMISKLEYNEIGQVVRKRLHSEDDGATFLQNVDFRYNIRGWMTHINNLSNDDADDYFGMELAYNGAVPGGGGNPTRKDGMITAVSWKEDLSEKRKLYNFTYDGLGQLNAGTFKAGIRTPGNPPTYAWNLQPDFYNESGITYDYNGNIQTLNRNAGIYNTSSYQATAIDQLTYDYSSYGGNQLGKVTEGLTTANKVKGFKDGTNTGDDYGYDVNGALLYDKNKGIDSLKYYFNDRPRRVKFGTGAGALAGHYMIYTYDAAGLKLQERYYNAAGTLLARKDYVGGIESVNGQVLQVAYDEGRITAPSGVNHIDNDEAGSTAGFTAQNAALYANYLNNQTYLRVTCTTTANPGVYPIATTEGDSYPVKAGESYTFRVLGYQSSGTTAKLYVKTNVGDLVWQGAALPSGSANENWVTATFTIPDSATWIQVGVRWSTPSVGNRFYLNRIALYKTDLEYNYFLADQVGSPRAILQARPSTVIHMATMETENHADENLKWNNLNASKFVVQASANATPGGNQAIRMNNAYRIGPAKSFKVFPGDLITGSVSAYFTSTSGYTAATAGTMATALSSVLAGGTAAIDGGITTAYNTTGNPLIVLGGFGGSSFPSGYLNYILFDENYVPIKAKSFPVQNLPSTRHTIQFDAPLEVKELGYLFVYLSYDNNQSSLYLYFDDLKVVVDESPLIQVNNYYPFGMVSNTWLREGEQQNANLFQGKELISQTGWHDFGSRMYWADLGRWFATDPQKQFSSPYVGMGNMPAIAVDPNGELAWFIPVVIGAAMGGTSQGIIEANNGGNFFEGFAKGAIVGGIAGAWGFGAGTMLQNTLGSFGSALAGGAVGGFMGGGMGSSINGGNFLDGAWRGAVTGLVGAGLGGIGVGESFGANVALGIGEGAATGALGAALFGGDVGQGALYGGLAGGVFATATSPQLRNAFKGQKFRSNSKVLADFVKAGDYQGALKYFRFQGTYDPSRTAGNPGVTDTKTGEIFYADNAFGVYDGNGNFTADYSVLRSNVDHELFHRTSVLSGKYGGKQITPEMRGLEEHGAYLRNYKRNGLYPGARKAGLEDILNSHGLVGGLYDGTKFFQAKWWHFIYRIPRRY